MSINNRTGPGPWSLLIALFLLATCVSNLAADLAEAQEQLLSGNYPACIAAANTALEKKTDQEDWSLLLTRALLATGRYPEALQTITNAVTRDYQSLSLRWLAREAYLCNGQPEAAA